VQVSDAEVQERFELDHTRVNLAFAKFAAADLTKDVSLTDADLEKYLADHADRYRVPTRLRAHYVVYRPGDVEGEINPTDGEISEYYVLHKEDRFAEPEQVHAHHILVKAAPGGDEAARKAAREKAEAIRAQIAGGADFATVAKEKSDDTGSAAQGGDLGFISRGRTAPAFESAAFALEPGTVSDVVETPFGFHVIKVEEHRQAGFKALDAVRDEVVQSLRHEGALETVRKQAETARRAVVGGKSLAEAAGDHPVADTGPFAVDEPIPGLGAVKPFSEAAFALTEGEVSDLVETDDAIYLLSPFERVDAHTPPLADVRDKVEADARRERSEALAAERAEKLLARAKEIGLESAAKEAGVTVEETGGFDRRTGAIPKIGAVPTLRTEALALTADTPLAPHTYVANGDAFVVALRERIPADTSELANLKDGLHEQVLKEKQETAGQAYLDYLKERAQQEGALLVRLETLDRG